MTRAAMKPLDARRTGSPRGRKGPRGKRGRNRPAVQSCWLPVPVPVMVGWASAVHNGLAMSNEQPHRGDPFVLHASEDKDSFVRPLAHTLRVLGLEVWYDEFSLRIGDSLSRRGDIAELLAA